MLNSLDLGKDKTDILTQKCNRFTTLKICFCFEPIPNNTEFPVMESNSENKYFMRFFQKYSRVFIR